MAVAIADAFRNIRVIQPTVPEASITTVAAEVVGDTLSITAGLGITITADPETDTLVISNTGNGTGAYTEISDTNSNSTFYPLFSRPFEPTDINPLDTPPSYQLDAIYVDNTTNPMTYNPSTGTLTAVTFAGNLTGNAGTVTNGVYTNGSYSDPSWLSISATKVGLGNVTNESKSTMFSSPTFTGTVSGITATMVGLGNVTNESKSTMFTDPTFTGTVNLSSIQSSATNITIQTSTTFGDPGFNRGKIELASGGYNDYIVPNTGYTHRFYVGSTLVLAMPSNNGILGDVLTTDGDGFASWTTITATTVGLGNVTNESKATMFSSPTFTGTVSGVTATMVGLGNVTNESKATMFSSPTFTGTVSGVTATMVGLGNVTNESKATMFSSPTFTGTVSGITSSMVGLGNVENTALSTSTFNIGTTSIQYNRASATQSLTGVNIDGSAGSVPASGITGTTLASGVTASSLTSVGTLTSLSVTNNISTVSGMFSAPLATKTSTSAGTAGQVAWDANYIYVCTATNTWKRVALTAGVF